MNAPFATSLSVLLRRGAAGFALVALVAGCSGSHGASDSGTAAPDAAASSAAGAASSAPDASMSSAPDASASGDASGAAAGGAGAGGTRAGGRKMMAKALASVGLSDDQKAQIRSIMKATRAENANADPATKRANYRAAFEKVQAVLTPDQQAAFKAKMAELRAQAAQTQ